MRMRIITPRVERRESLGIRQLSTCSSMKMWEKRREARDVQPRQQGKPVKCKMTHLFMSTYLTTNLRTRFHSHGWSHGTSLLYILSSTHLLRTLPHVSFSSRPFLSSMPNPNPCSTHSLPSISVSRDRARANANRSSSPLNSELDFSADIESPRSSMRSCMASGRMSLSFWLPRVEVEDEEDERRDALISAEERKRLVMGTAVVRTSFAYWVGRKWLSCPFSSSSSSSFPQLSRGS